jgi:hypothetical protein
MGFAAGQRRHLDVQISDNVRRAFGGASLYASLQPLDLTFRRRHWNALCDLASCRDLEQPKYARASMGGPREGAGKQLVLGAGLFTCAACSQMNNARHVFDISNRPRVRFFLGHVVIAHGFILFMLDNQ